MDIINQAHIPINPIADMVARLPDFLDVREGAVVAAEPARVTEPTLWQQYAALPCGQQIGVLLVILMVLLSFELPDAAKNQLGG
jgi:hypothetical protein